MVVVVMSTSWSLSSCCPIVATCRVTPRSKKVSTHSIASLARTTAQRAFAAATAVACVLSASASHAKRGAPSLRPHMPQSLQSVPGRHEPNRAPRCSSQMPSAAKLTSLGAPAAYT